MVGQACGDGDAGFADTSSVAVYGSGLHAHVQCCVRMLHQAAGRGSAAPVPQALVHVLQEVASALLATVDGPPLLGQASLPEVGGA